jgi:hypothetical protein
MSAGHGGRSAWLSNAAVLTAVLYLGFVILWVLLFGAAAFLPGFLKAATRFLLLALALYAMLSRR